MTIDKQLSILIDETLILGGRGLGLQPQSPLAGALPEMDSMGVVALIEAMEERFDIEISDQEIDGGVFQTFGSLLAFLTRKVGTASP